MTTKIMKFKGTCQWAKVFPENRDMLEWDDETMSFSAPSSHGGTYSIELIMSPEDYRELKMSGSLAAKNSKLNEAGEDVCRFKRQHERRGKGGVLLEFASGPPKVIDAATGLPWDINSQGVPGNGSEVEVTIAVYTTKFSPGTRLEEVSVINYVAIEDKESEDS